MTAKEKLLEVMQRRKWYGELISPASARALKHNLVNDGSVSDEKVVETLRLLGYEPRGVRYELKEIEMW